MCSTRNNKISKKIKQQEQWTSQFTLTQEQLNRMLQEKLDRTKQYSLGAQRLENLRLA